ncbi:triglyceride lipase [Maudiozyma humilis]|uniref:Triglyceride lipase n=1 Tax=Maudiozyma humilis TaxID=51915 RepID=A0AAV5RPX9_MAUHU|nr:triglyceride lipase [Kazachstania humilis]
MFSTGLPFWRKQKPAAPSLRKIAASTNDPSITAFAALYSKHVNTHTKEPANALTKPNYTKYTPPKYPVILCHGLSGFDTLILIPSISMLVNVIVKAIDSNNSENFVPADDKNILEVEYWTGVRELLESKGCTVFTARVPPFGSIEERASTLNSSLNSITRQLNLQNQPIKFNFIAHSMGGLDCRYLISRIPQEDKQYGVASLTTLSTPHGGSEVADFMVNQFEKVRSSLNNKGPLLPMCYYQLTTYYAQYFNDITPDDGNVKYFSYGAYFSPKWYSSFNLTWSIINYATDGEPNDGMVTVKSSHWGKYMGTLPNTDHLDIINWRNRVHDTFEQLIRNKEAPDSILQLYLNITHNLGQNGC